MNNSKKFSLQPLAQVALVGGSVAVAIATLAIYSGFEGFIDIQVGPQGGRLTIDSRQLVNETEAPQLQADKRK